MHLPGIPKHISAGGILAGETRADAGLRVWRSLLHALSRDDLATCSVLDIGCGDRIAHAIAEHSLAFGSYFGTDNRKPLIEWLSSNVRDPRCTFSHFDAYNVRYWPTGKLLSKRMDLGDGSFDVVFAQSVFSHLYPHEADIMLALARRRIRTQGQFVLTCFLSETVTLFEDRHGDDPTLRFYYHPEFMRTLLRKNGWEVTRMLPPGEPGFGQGTQDAVVCRPIEPLALPPGFG